MNVREPIFVPISLLVTASLLSGCVAVDIPDRSRAGIVTNPTSLNRQATFIEGMNYLQLARTTLRRRSRNMETFDAVTRLGVGIGVAGAGIRKDAADRDGHPFGRAGPRMTGGRTGCAAMGRAGSSSGGAWAPPPCRSWGASSAAFGTLAGIDSIRALLPSSVAACLERLA